MEAMHRKVFGQGNFLKAGVSIGEKHLKGGAIVIFALSFRFVPVPFASA